MKKDIRRENGHVISCPHCGAPKGVWIDANKTSGVCVKCGNWNDRVPDIAIPEPRDAKTIEQFLSLMKYQREAILRQVLLGSEKHGITLPELAEKMGWDCDKIGMRSGVTDDLDAIGWRASEDVRGIWAVRRPR